MSVQDARQILPANSKSVGGFRDGQIQRVQAFLPDNFSRVRRRMHQHGRLAPVLCDSVIVDVVHIGDVVARKAKHNPPVFGDSNGVEAFIVASKRMEAQSWKVNVFGAGCLIKDAQNATQLRYMVRVDFGGVVVLAKLCQSLMAYFVNHEVSRVHSRHCFVPRYVTRYGCTSFLFVHVVYSCILKCIILMSTIKVNLCNAFA